VNLGKQLHDLQQVDLDLDSKAEELRQLDSQLSDDKVLTQAQAELEREQDYLAEMEKKQKGAEWIVEDLQAKLKPLQEKLYAGSVKNPKELLSLQQQVKDLKTQIRNEEDGVLEIMSRVEASQKEMSSKTAEVKRLKKEWQKRQKELSADLAELKAAISIAEQKRSELTTSIEPAHLELYETLRVKKQKQAVAKIEQGRCQGCRITLPMSELQRARIGDLVQCSSCSRILCLG
jgi:predicted  nucleic acid-binding Zn-ribbon protein